MATPPPPQGQGDYPPPPGHQDVPADAAGAAGGYPPPPGADGPLPDDAGAGAYPPPPGGDAMPAGAMPDEDMAPAAAYPPPPPAKTAVGGLEGAFLNLAKVGGGMLTIIFTLAGAVLAGLGFIIVGAGNSRDVTKIPTTAEAQQAVNLVTGGNILAGIGLILALFGVLLFLVLIKNKK